MKFLSLVLICFSLIACSNRGTDTGNPGIKERAPADQIDLKTGMIGQLSEHLCVLLERCDAINQCEARVLQQTNINVKLGLEPNEFANLNEVAGAVSVGILVEDPGIGVDCFEDIDALTCSSTNVPDAFNPLSTNPFEGVAKIVPASCEGLVH